MKITIVGTGYVGLVTGTCFAEVGINVVCVDIDQKKIDNLKKGISPIYEPGLDVMIERNIEKGRLLFTTDLASCVNDTDVYFYCCRYLPRTKMAVLIFNMYWMLPELLARI